MLTGKYASLFEKLITVIDKGRIFHDALHTLAFGTDASFYRLIPKMVIKAVNEDEVSFILRECSKLAVPVTFRAAGTSLSGQSVTDSVLVIASANWKKFRISTDGSEICLQPGITGGRVNALLAPFGRKIGPDPASINAAMIGGIAANNASGMCCGTSENSYKTITGIRIIFPDGTILDTRDETSKQQFSELHPEIISELTELAMSTTKHHALAERIRQKYRIKNTTGYSLNALVDFSDPFKIIEHLIIGSEGTLAFISEISYRTVPELPCKATSLMIFDNIRNACEAVISLKSTPVSAVELIDRSGLKSVEQEEGIPEYISKLGPDKVALLVETVAQDNNALDDNILKIKKSVAGFKTVTGISFTSIPSEYDKLWKIRKGLFPSVGAMRQSGTTVIIEDVAFPLVSLADATIRLRKLLDESGYDEAVIFGHALEGNLHFVFTQNFSTPEEIAKYKVLMAAVSDLVVNKYDGSLKAEHGTGRNMAPFVEMEWGAEAYTLMKKIKQIFDPLNILNPGVILNPDPEAHIKNLKPVHEADKIIDKCTECGFCEPSCVSAGLTLTPRQRIVVHREITYLTKTGREPHMAASLLKGFSYAGNETCATDGLCSVSCPVKIDTGKLIKTLRATEIASKRFRGMWIANHMDIVTSAGRKALSFVTFFHSLLGTKTMLSISQLLRKASGEAIPLWNPYMPWGAHRIKTVNDIDKTRNRKVVYFPSCINRAMGVSKDYNEEVQLTTKMVQLFHKAGYEVIYPVNINNLCCGMAFLSKGFTDAGLKKSGELEAAIMKASNMGEYPVVCDMSPCLFTMKENFTRGIKLYEPVEFILDNLLPFLEIVPVNETVTVFPVCSTKKMGLEDKLLKLARLCATDVIIPETNCCGFAGDRGFTFPELNRHGLRELRGQLDENVKNGYSTSRTCEIGLSLHTGITYKSIVYLVDIVSSPKSSGVPEIRTDK